MIGVLCTHCGQTNPGGSRFCARCGRSLATAPPERPPGSDELSSTLPHSWKAEPEGGGESLIGQVSSTLEALPAGSALLVVTRGPNAGSRFALETEMTVGRHPKSDVLLDDVTVSRRHAELYLREGAFLVRDVGSLNGTYVNRERVEEVALARGDELQIGKFRLVFLVP